MKRIEKRASFGGWQEVWEHQSVVLSCAMRFGVFFPASASERALPVLYFLSGLTCSEQNVMTKSGAQRYAAEHDVILVFPDTSPRGDDVPDVEGWDMGKGASFYVNATESPWDAHYRMYDYVRDELPALVDASFKTSGHRSITGHSMGGHGALVIALKNPGMFQSVSAFSPVVAPTQVPWGKKAFAAYLGPNTESWRAWDSCALIAEAKERLPLLVDQGGADSFLEEQLQSQLLASACKSAGHPLILRMQPGYDHSYYFIATFVGDHIAHHAAALHQASEG